MNSVNQSLEASLRMIARATIVAFVCEEIRGSITLAVAVPVDLQVCDRLGFLLLQELNNWR